MVEKKIITVQNAEGDVSTQAEILIQNKINYTPKVSVIIPVYNVEQYLHECLDSVVNQTLKEIEIICVDDGSTDNSLEILKEYAKKDKRITIILQKNLHAGVARNAGLAVAKGEYLSFLDSDDFFELNMLEEMFNLSKKYKNDLTICRYKNFNNKTKTVEEIRGINQIYETEIATISTKSIKKKIFTICNPMPWNKLIRKDFILDNGIRFQSLPVSNDIYFSMMSMACSKKITFYYKPLIFYRYNRKESARNIRDKHPFCFYYAYKQLYLSLKTRKLYNYYKKAFLTSLVSSSLWTLDNTDIMRNDVMKLIKDKIITEFDVFCGVLPDWMSDKLKNKLRPELIISLTSYPARINTVNQVIESLLNQTMKADKVILWLAPEQFPNGEADLPEQLLDLKDKGLIIDWYKDIRSYKKLIPTLKKYPDAIIVTADDDNLYKPEWLEKLYNSYKKYPNDIQAHRITMFYYNQMFQYISGGREYYHKASYLNKLVGLGGVLYPPHCFYKDILNEELFMKLAPTNDDQWFWFQAMLNKTKVRVVKNPLVEANYIPGSQECGLTNINDKGPGLFWKDFNRLLDYYPTLEKMMIEESKKHKIRNIELRSHLEGQLKEWYKRGTKKNLNLDNPKTFNEKIQWLKLYDSTPIKTRLADKYLVRDWIKEKIGEEYLIPLLGVYDKFEDIDFSKLPNQFVIKCNHGSGYNIIVKDKSQLDIEDVRNKINAWMNENFAFRAGYELHYRDIEPKIIIEEYIENAGTNDLYDYKFWCFDGKVYYIQFLSERNLSGLKMAFYDINWIKQTFAYDHPVDIKNIDKPTNLNEMIKLAEKLSKGFNHVRVDFYRMNDGKLYFGEMTFTSATGRQKWSDEKINQYFGSLIKLPELAYNIDTKKYYKLPVLTWKEKLLKKVYSNIMNLFCWNRSICNVSKRSFLGIPLYKSNKKPYGDWATKIYLFCIPTYIIRQKGNVKRHSLFNFIPLYKKQKIGKDYTKKFYLLGLPIIVLKKQKIIRILGLKIHWFKKGIFTTFFEAILTVKNKYIHGTKQKYIRILGIKFYLFKLNKMEKNLLEWYFKQTKKEMDLRNPKTFNEKIQWLKLYDSTPIKTRLADKYLVRDWVKEKIGEEYLIPLLGVYDKFEDIDFSKLPNQFVIKCNHGSGYNIIVKDKSQLDIEDARNKINAWMNENFAFRAGYELHYRDIEPKIIIEEYVKPELSNIEIQSWCFDGELKYISYETVKDEKDAKRCIFSPDWKVQDFMISPNKYNSFEKTPVKPKYLDELLKIVSILCKDFSHVRVDFIEYKNKLMFREMTFTSASGLSKFEPENISDLFGSLITLPSQIYDFDKKKFISNTIIKKAK